MVQTKGNPLIGKLSVDSTEGVSVALGKQKCQKLRVFLEFILEYILEFILKKMEYILKMEE